MPDTLAQRIKAKYPGQYDDLSDQDLEAKITAKYPGVYDDIPKTTVGPHPEARIGAAAPPLYPGGPPSGRSPESVDQFGNPKLISPRVEHALTDPLIRPTGIGLVDAQFSPINLTMLAIAGGPKAASMVAGAAKSLSAQVGEGLAARILKFAANRVPGVKTIKTVQEAADILSDVKQAMRSKAAPPVEAAEPASPSAPAPVTAVEPVRPSPTANATGTSMYPGPVLGAKSPQQLLNEEAIMRRRAAMQPPAPVSAPVEAAPAAPAAPVVEPAPVARAGKSPAQIANEEALARRRAEYQARVAQGAAPASNASAVSAASPAMSEAPPADLAQLQRQGMSLQQAREVLARQLQERLGLSTPTQAETEFPKGQRGKLTPKPPLTDAQTAASAPTVKLYHGSPSKLGEVQPGSMLSDDPTWAAGYTTKDVGGIVGQEQFAGHVHSVEVPTSGKTIQVRTLHAAESKLLELGRQALGREPRTLKEAALAVSEKMGIDTIIAKRVDGSIAGAIPLRSTPVSATMNPVEVIESAISNGRPVPDNLKEALTRTEGFKNSPRIKE